MAKNNKMLYTILGIIAVIVFFMYMKPTTNNARIIRGVWVRKSAKGYALNPRHTDPAGCRYDPPVPVSQ